MLLAEVGPRWGPVGAALLANHRRRIDQVRMLTTDHDILIRAIGQSVGRLQWLARIPDLHPELVHLLETATKDLEHGVESILTERDPRSLDVSRHLMEIESLLRLFAREPRELEEWVDIEPHLRHGAYGFGKLTQREGRARGIPDDQVLPERTSMPATVSLFIRRLPMNIPRQRRSSLRSICRSRRPSSTRRARLQCMPRRPGCLLAPRRSDAGYSTSSGAGR